MELSYLPVFVAVAVTVLVYFWNKKRRRSRNLPPGPSRIPFFGSAHKMTEHRHLDMLKLQKKYGNLIRLTFFNQEIICVVGYEANKELFDRGKDFSDRDRLDFFMGLKWDGEKQSGIVSNPYGESWMAHRKLFHTVAREIGLGRRGIEVVIKEEARYMLQEFDKVIEPDQLFDPFLFINIAVLNVVASFIFGDRYEYHDKKMKRLLDINNAILQSDETMKDPLFFLSQIIPGLNRFWLSKSAKSVKRKFECLVEFCAEEVEEHKKTLDRKAPKDFIDYYLLKIKNQSPSDKPIYTEHDLRITLLDLFMAGGDTTTTTLRWAILYMAGHQDVQKKVREEIDQILGFDREAKYEDRMQMPFTEAMIHEVQRVSNILPTGIMHAAIADMEFQGYFLPKGTCMWPCTYSSHHQQDQWKNSEAFYPENFLDENGKFVIRDAFMPFGGGNRICPGMTIAKQELFLFLVGILQRYEIRPEKADGVDYEPVTGLLLYPKPQKFYFIKRE